MDEPKNQENKRMNHFCFLFADIYPFSCLDYVQGVMCMCVCFPSNTRVSKLLMEVPGTPVGTSVFEFKLKPTGKDFFNSTLYHYETGS